MGIFQISPQQRGKAQSTNITMKSSLLLLLLLLLVAITNAKKPSSSSTTTTAKQASSLPGPLYTDCIDDDSLATFDNDAMLGARVNTLKQVAIPLVHDFVSVQWPHQTPHEHDDAGRTCWDYKGVNQLRQYFSPRGFDNNGCAPFNRAATEVARVQLTIYNHLRAVHKYDAREHRLSVQYECAPKLATRTPTESQMKEFEDYYWRTAIHVINQVLIYLGSRFVVTKSPSEIESMTFVNEFKSRAWSDQFHPSDSGFDPNPPSPAHNWPVQDCFNSVHSRNLWAEVRKVVNAPDFAADLDSRHGDVKKYLKCVPALIPNVGWNAILVDDSRYRTPTGPRGSGTAARTHSNIRPACGRLAVVQALAFNDKNAHDRSMLGAACSPSAWGLTKKKWTYCTSRKPSTGPTNCRNFADCVVYISDEIVKAMPMCASGYGAGAAAAGGGIRRSSSNSRLTRKSSK